MIKVFSNGKLGDNVEVILEKTGIGPAVKKITKAVGIEDCGCDKRKEILNDFGDKIVDIWQRK